MMIDLTNLTPAPRKMSYEGLSVQLLDAAIELNRLERGEISKCETVAAVLLNLGLRDSQFATGDDLRKVVDPKTIDIYSRVVPKLTTEKTDTINELAAHVRKYSIFKDSESSSKEVAAIKAFFLALHREILAENYGRLDEEYTDRM